MRVGYLLTLQDVAILFLLTLPYYFIHLRLQNEKEIFFSKQLAEVIIVPWGTTFMFGFMFIESGEYAFMYVFSIVPINVAMFFGFNKFINQINQKKEEKFMDIETLIFGLTKKQIAKVMLITIVLAAFIVVVTGINGKRVLAYHKEFIVQIEEAEDKEKFILKYTDRPGSVIEALPYLKEIKRGKNHIGYSSPWRMHIRVRAMIKGLYRRVEFTYYRYNDNSFRLYSVHDNGVVFEN